jgi:ankyrin repeat protein
MLRDHIELLSGEPTLFDSVKDLIVNKRADPNIKENAYGHTLLMQISFLGRNEVEGFYHDDLLKTFEFLLELDDIRVDTVNNFSYTLLNMVTKMRDPTFLAILLDKSLITRENVNALDDNGQNELHHACFDGNTPITIIELLLNAGADPTMKNAYLGRTPLHMAIHAYRINRDTTHLLNILNVFFKRGVDPNIQDNNHCTLLHAAAYAMCDNSVCTTILENGAIQNTRDNRGNNPLEAAQSVNNNGAIYAITTYNKPFRNGTNVRSG